MNKTYLIPFFLLTIASCTGQSATQKPLRFDLSQLGMVVNGRQICEDKGRLQDNPSRVMDQIAAAGPQAVPTLIGMIADSRLAQTEEPIICFWPSMAIGDIAFCLLADLFTDPSGGRTTVPGASWNDLLGPNDSRPAWEQLHDYIKKHGRTSLQAKWRSIWDKYGSQLVWDPKERCFKVKGRE